MSEILQVLNLVKRFEIGGGFLGSPRQTVRAVNDVSFSVMRGQSLGLVGESGCGKSTVARTLLRLVEPDEGTILFDGTDLRAADAAQLRALRRRIQLVFQDPYASLNPRRTVRQERRVVEGPEMRVERLEPLRRADLHHHPPAAL